MNLLMCAYACEPNKGSEPEVGWRWMIKNSNKYEKVTVVTRHISKESIENEFKNLNINNVDFIYFELPNWIIFWERTSIGEQLCAYLWEIHLFFFLLGKFKKKQFDVTQRVTFVSYRFPTLIWYFGKTFIFGPISGGERFPLNFLKIFSLKGKLRELARIFIRNLALFDPFVLLSLYKADQIIAVTKDSKTILPKFCQNKVKIEPAISIDINDFKIENFEKKINKNCLKLLYIGRLLEWKGIKLTLESLKDIDNTKYEFNIIGEGKDKFIFESYAKEYNLNVNFLGQKTRNELSEYYFSHDLFVFPSLHDSGGMVVLESKAHGLPVLVGTFGGPQQFIGEKDILIKSQDVDGFILEMRNKFIELINEKN